MQLEKLKKLADLVLLVFILKCILVLILSMPAVVRFQQIQVIMNTLDVTINVPNRLYERFISNGYRFRRRV